MVEAIDTRTVEFTCGCRQRLRFVCEPKSGGVLVSMGCCERFRLPGDVVQIFALHNGEWLRLHTKEGWIEGRTHQSLTRS